MAQEDEDLQMAIRSSLNEFPEPKMSKPEDSPEKRPKGEAPVETSASSTLGDELSPAEANQLFSMVFGDGVTTGIIAQWSNQGIRFSPDSETSMGLVQHEGGPCGVLATIQGSFLKSLLTCNAFVLKHLLFTQEELDTDIPVNLDLRRSLSSGCVDQNIFASLTEERKSKSLGEMLFLCGSNRRAVIASLVILDFEIKESDDNLKEEIITKALKNLSVESAYDLQKILRVNMYTSLENALLRLKEMIPVFRSRMGAILFLISALLSRGLDAVRADRDDPSQPLVTAPFGHASQEIVNLLLSGQAVGNVFDGKIDLGGGMFVNGVSTNVEIRFLTLLESLNFCKVGQNLKYPKWPIWVVGSESHYTVIFALDVKIQEENETEGRKTQIYRAFEAQDQSGGGGFISEEGFHQVLMDTNINLPKEKVEYLCETGYIVWSEFWKVVLELDESLGVKELDGLMGKKAFDLYHFNGIAKLVPNEEGTPTKRPRLTKLTVSVPPTWTCKEFTANVSIPSGSDKDAVDDFSKPESGQHAPLVDCIRTRWPGGVCNWEGDPPSIV